MRRIRTSSLAAALAAAAILQLVAGSLHAQTPKPHSAPASQPSKPVTPVMKGQPAPYSGLLVPEKRFVQDLRMRIDHDGLKYKLKLREKHHQEDTQIWSKSLGACQKDLNKKSEPTPWYKSPKTWFVVGTVVGLAAGIFTVYGTSKLLEK